MANYRFVVDNHYEPFTFQEMLVPWTMYKDAFEKADEAYTELQNKADVFKYLSKSLPEGSEARKLYENYANEVKEQAAFLNAHGYGANSRRALSSLKKRFQGEIGMLEEAETRRKKDMEARSALAAAGKPMIYAKDNPTIDDYLYGNTPNQYAVSRDDLYTKGAKLGQAISSRMYNTEEGGNVLGGYYALLKQTQGMNPKMINDFMNSKELDDAITQKLYAEGVLGNLTGNKLLEAKAAIKSGIYEGIVYTENNQIQRDLSKMTPEEIDQSRRGWANYALEKQKYADSRMDYYNSLLADGYVLDKTGRIVDFDPSKSLSVKKAAAVKAASSSKGSSGSSGSGGSSTEHKTQGKKGLRFYWNGNDPAKDKKLAENPEVYNIADDVEDHVGTLYAYEDLPQYAKDIADKRIGRGKASYYDYYFKPYSWGLFNDAEAELEIVPKNIVTDDPVGSLLESLYSASGE